MMVVGLRGKTFIGIYLITISAYVCAQQGAGMQHVPVSPAHAGPALQQNAPTPSGPTSSIHVPAAPVAAPAASGVPAAHPQHPHAQHHTVATTTAVPPVASQPAVAQPVAAPAPAAQAPAQSPAQQPAVQVAPQKVAAPAPVTPAPIPAVVAPSPMPVVQPQPVQPIRQAVTPAPAVMQKKAVMAPSEEAVDEEELAGIDTVDLESPQGNWLFKRLWWERAEEKYEEIRALEAHILELRMPFFMKRTDVDRSILDPFYLHVAQDRGALEILLSDISEFLVQEAQEGMLNETERGIRDQLQTESETLKQLQKNIQAVLNYDRELDAAIGTLMEQLNRVSVYEQEAWAYFKEIGRVLDDKKAREYVLKMKNIHRNIKEIEDYIKERFAVYFDQLIASIKENSEQVTIAMDQLTEKGIDLKEHLNQIKNEAQGIYTEEPEEMPKPKIEEPGFFDRWILSPVISIFSSVWNGIATILRWPYDLIFGAKKPAPEPLEEYEEEVVEEPKELREDE